LERANQNQIELSKLNQLEIELRKLELGVDVNHHLLKSRPDPEVLAGVLGKLIMDNDKNMDMLVGSLLVSNAMGAWKGF
jgi:hypothetical protein